MIVEIDPIGVVESSRREPVDDFWGGAVACVVLDERFAPDALEGLDRFSHAEIIFSSIASTRQRSSPVRGIRATTPCCR